MAAFVAADGDELEAGAGADDIDDAAGGMGDVEVLGIDLGRQRRDSHNQTSKNGEFESFLPRYTQINIYNNS